MCAFIEILEKKTKDDVLSEEEQEVAKPKETSLNMQSLLEDDESIEEEENTKNHAQAEDDVSEESSHDESDYENSGKSLSKI